MFDAVGRTALTALLPLAVWIVVSGLDDLLVLGVFLHHRNRPGSLPSWQSVKNAPRRRIAIFVPCWREDGVIEDMIAHNASAIRYPEHDIFVGAYPNDQPTIDAIRRLEARYSHVHLSLCPGDGPTSKADCLNWIYQRMLLFEEERDVAFDIVLTHDAEDLIHPDELDWINCLASNHEFIQVPVLPLQTPIRDFTHGLYCDDFAECHTKDMVARQAMGGFLPSSGVGTGYTRAALEKLATAESNRIFEPACLTEDYENGLRLHEMGCRQVFMPLTFRDGAPIATREYFPRKLRGAVKQRTRWVTGISLQTWQRHGWRGGLRQVYWLWRDRKGLIGNPASLFANVLFLYGLATWSVSLLSGGDWGLGAAINSPLLLGLLIANAALQLTHLGVRMACVTRIYGLLFSLGVPFRTVYGNWLNTMATTRALVQFGVARLLRRPLVWVKTEHAYPSRVALLPHKRPLEEILVGSGYLSPRELAHARSTKPRGIRLAEHLVHAKLLTEGDLYEALSLQLGLALGRIEPGEVSRNIARCLPAHVIREWNVLPVRIEGGSIHLASPDLPTDELHEALRRFTRLEIRIELVTPTNYRRLAEALL